jgi:hypothetical protein
MDITNLMGTSWKLNNPNNLTGGSYQYYDVKGIVEGYNEAFEYIQVQNRPLCAIKCQNTRSFRAYSDYTQWQYYGYNFENNGTIDYLDNPIVTFNGGEDLANNGLISWLEANATLIEAEPTATITYGGETIATLKAGQTATIKTAETEVEYDIVVKAGGAKAEEVESTHAFYNGVKLPKIPEDVLAQYPYCWIRSDGDGSIIDLVCAQYPWYVLNETLYIPDSTWVQYMTYLSSEVWTYKTSYTDNGRFGFGKAFIWSNHDIPNGSADATDIYFEGTEPEPIGEEPKTTPIVITYDGNEIASIKAGQTATIKCANTEVEFDIVVSAKAEEDDSIVGTWVFKDVISADGLKTYNNDKTNGKRYEVAFKASGRTYCEVTYDTIYDRATLNVATSSGSGTYAYSWYGAYGENVWQNEKFKTWEITEEPTDAEFIAWLKANATKQ